MNLLLICAFLPSTTADDFCDVHGEFVDELHNAISETNREVSGLALNAVRTHFFSISDSPEGDPRIFITTNTPTPSHAASIKITGIENAGFNGGYGDWEALVSYPCSMDRSRQCIVIGDIGHNKVRDRGGAFRTSAQSVRFIEVEEPSATEISSGQILEKPGSEFKFSYPHGANFDAEAMVVKDGRLFVITKNSDAYDYCHMFEVPALTDGVELVQRAIFRVRYSEVTGAASSPGYLILRTYIGLNFYKWDALCDDAVRKSTVYQSIDFLKRDRGLQEAVEYDASTGNMYLAGEGSSTLYRMQCAPAASQDLRPVFDAQCLDTYAGEASQVSNALAVSGSRHASKFLAMAMVITMMVHRLP
ncbi:unnamed protein product [Effrenium voratum]|nr:unnamed protein product [Effrenium voratum]